MLNFLKNAFEWFLLTWVVILIMIWALSGKAVGQQVHKKFVKRPARHSCENVGSAKY